MIFCPPGTSTEHGYRQLYRMCLAFWILFGLACISTIISMGQDAFQDTVDKVEDATEKEAEKKDEEVRGYLKIKIQR